MVTSPDPLVQFSERLYFTTFPSPVPTQNVLNDLKTQPRPKVRSRTRFNGQMPSPDDHATYYFFTVDDDLPYMSFFEDWGPLNLGQVYKACILIHELLEDKELKPHRLCLYTSNDPRRKANAALLMALFVMIVQRRQPWEAFHPIAEMEFMPFRDAGRGRSDFNLSIQDCLWGFWKATHYGLCDLNDFSLEDYEYYEKVENGDWNWITPHFIAFASPVDTVWMKKGGANQQSQFSSQPNPTQASNGQASQPTQQSPSISSASVNSSSSSLQRRLPTPYLNCLEYFSANNIKTVVRLNNPLYDKNTFIERGFEHVELYFDDGTNPTDEIVRKFLEIADRNIQAGGVVAVHCKAGLGRTGTLIGAYLVYKYGFTANEAIAFMRIVRPGCVVGPQQQYMYTRQLEWSKWAAIDEYSKAEEAKKATNSRDAITPPMEDIQATPVEQPSTPPRKTATSEPLVPQTIQPPGQPRKTPATKRVITTMDIDSEAEEKEAEDIVTSLASAAPPAAPKTISGRTTPTNVRGRVGTTRQPRQPPATERINRTTRSTTRSAAITGPRRPGTTGVQPSIASSSSTAAKAGMKPTVPIAGVGASLGVRTRGAAAAAATGTGARIPRLAANPTTASTSASKTLPTTRRSARAPSPSPTPSRLPTLIPTKRGYGAPHGPLHSMSDTNTRTMRKISSSSRSKISSAIETKPTEGDATEADENEDKLDPDAWINGDAAGTVVIPGSKSERPGLRSVKRRRSSFSSADVVA